MIVYVARHGETEWNRQGRYQGQRESQLTSLGVRQAEALASALARCGARRVIASPLARCTATATAVAAALGVSLETDRRLLEIGHGAWEGRLSSEVAHDDGDRLRAWREAPATVSFPGGESLEAVAARWRGFAGELDGKNDVVLVTHDVLVRVAVLEARGRSLAHLWEPRVLNGGYARFLIQSGRWALLDECCESHLAGMLADTSRQAR